MSDTQRYDNNADLSPTTVIAGPDQVDATAYSAAYEGQRIGRIITTRDYLDGRDANDVIAGATAGQVILLGNLIGVVNSTERKSNDYKGKMLESVWLNGEFEATVRGVDARKAAPTAILPTAFGITIETELARLAKENDPSAQLTIDCDIGLQRVTRGAIAFEWVVVFYREGRPQKAMREARARRDARLSAYNGGRIEVIAPVKGS